MATPLAEFTGELALSAPDFGLELDTQQIERLGAYYQLFLHWNDRLHLVAPCSPGEFAVRHVLESLLLVKHLPGNASIVDVGSGAGLPIIPCLLLRDDLRATLIESSKRKGVFLREALRAVQPASRTGVLVRRFAEAPAPQADFVSCRALDQFVALLPKLVEWAPPRATLLLFGGEALRQKISALAPSAQIELIPKSEKRFLITVHLSS